MTMTDKTKDIPFAACNFGCEGFVELVPARESVARTRTAPTSLAPTPTPARASALLLREEAIREQATLAERALLAERLREDAILDAALLPEQGELAAELIASGLEFEEAHAFLTLDLLSMCEQLQRSAE